MPAMLSFILECGISTAGNNARLALRIRQSMSEIGSFINLPTGFRHARNQTVQRGFAESHTRTAELPKKTATPSAHRATVDYPGRAGIARQLSQTRIVPFGL